MHRLPYVVVAAVLALAGSAPAAARVASPGHHLPDHPLTATATHPGGTAPTGADRADRAGTAGTVGHPRPAAGQGTDEVDLMSVWGAGPFRMGARLDRLSAAGLIDWTAPACAGVVRAGVTGTWAGVVLLAFRNGRLVEIGTATAPPRSPDGAAVGMSFAQLEEIYGPRGALIQNDAGDASAYLVRVGSRVELFTGHPIRPGVGYFQVGPASFVERDFRQGHAC
ncbi:hypothetical protein E1193_03085 [Micromonospora sp. KC606]|uniref:hypothetical protein n=1 Tax=Micromonospora sp. KC606 TaxID=2530379 RepID=UPI00104B866C|nr:hypothetical protein [Micromonospora sp. KC606]TDC85295.1 hypothetical protein E1193_03085 [Micromonospora sp. KC606]